MVAMAVLVAALVLALFAVVLVPVGAATDDRSRSRTAADAAALAGAQAMAEQWVDVVTAPGLLRFGPPLTRLLPGTGSGAAASYATANGSSVTSYGADVRRGRATVVVRSNTSPLPENGSAEARAVAQVRAELGGCRWDDPLPATAEPVFERTLECGEWEATYLIANDGLLYPTLSYVGDSRDELLEDLEPRLVD